MTIDEFMNSLSTGRCTKCEYAHCVVATGQWMFLGCYHSPFHGKWVREIDVCPKKEREQE